MCGTDRKICQANREIIRCAERDADELYEVEKASFSSPLEKSTIEAMLKNPSARVYAVTDGKIRAFIAFEIVCGEGQVVSLAVHPDYRRRHFADALLARMKEEGLKLFTLEVRKENSPAIALYEKHGFGKVGLRRGYYENPPDDAVLMDLCLEE